MADDADVDPALVHYYYQDKKQLFLEVVSRRAEALNARRVVVLDQYELACRGNPTVEGTVDVFLRGFLDPAISGGPGWRNYLSVIVQTYSVPSWGHEIDEILERHFNPVTQRFIGLLRKCFPSASAQDLYYSFQQLAGSVMLTLSPSKRIERLSSGKCNADDLAGAVQRMIPYATGGFREVCNGTRKVKR